MTDFTSRFLNKGRPLHDISIYTGALFTALCLTLSTADAAYATCGYPAATVTLQDTTDLECDPSLTTNPNKGGCLPDSVTGTPTTGQITDCVVAGYDPPQQLRPDYGTGVSFSGMGSGQRGAGCAPGGACPSYAGVSTTPVNPLAAAALPDGEGLTNVTSNADGSITQALPCGGAAPMLSDIVNMDLNVPPAISFGNIISLGAYIQIGTPPINVPTLDVSIPTFTLPTLPTLNIPDLPDTNIPTFSASYSLPSIEGTLSLPPLNMPCTTSDGSCLNISTNFSMPAPTLPTINVPVIALPDVTLPSANIALSVGTDLITNLMDGGLLAGIPPVPSIDVLSNLAGNVTCPGSLMSLATNAIQLVMPPVTAATGYPDGLPETNVTVPAQTVGETLTLPGNEPLAFNLTTPPSVIELPNGGAFVGATAISDPNAPVATGTIKTCDDNTTCGSGGTNLCTDKTSCIVSTVTSSTSANQVVNFQPGAGGSPVIITLPPTWNPTNPNSTGNNYASFGGGAVVVGTPGSPIKIATPNASSTCPNGGTCTNVVMAEYSSLTAGSTNTPSGVSAVTLYTTQTQLGSALGTPLGQPTPAGAPGSQLITGANGTANQPDSQLDLTPYWVCLDNGSTTSYIYTPNQCNGSPCHGSCDSYTGACDGVTCGWQWLPSFLSAIIQYPYNTAATPPQTNMAVTASAVVVNSTTAQTTQQGITPPAQSFMSIPTGTPVSFNIAAAGASITLPAGGSILDAQGNKITIPQEGVIIALGQDPATGNYGVIGGFLLNTGAYAAQNQIQLPGSSVPATNPVSAPTIAVPTTGNILFAPDPYTQLATYGDTMGSGVIIEYPPNQLQLNIATTEVAVPPGVSVPSSTAANGSLVNVGTLTTPQPPSSLTTASTTTTTTTSTTTTAGNR